MKAGVVKEQYLTLMAKEESLLQNIKAKDTQKAVRTGIKKIRQFLQTLHSVPEQGLAIFAGDNDIHVIQPHIPLKMSFYQCGKSFEINLLQEYCQTAAPAATLYGWIHITGEEVWAGTLQGKALITHRFQRPGGVVHKHNKGGQSAPRFQRLFLQADEQWVRDVLEWVHAQVWKETMVHVFVGGIADNEKTLTQRLQSTWVRYSTHGLPSFSTSISTGCAIAFSAQVQEVHVPAHTLQQQQQVAHHCFQLLQTLPDKVVVGWPMVKRAADLYLIEKLYIEEPWQERWEGKLPENTVLVPAQTLIQLGGLCALLKYTYEGWDEN